MGLEVDHLVTTISPVLGQPTLRAVFDECHSARPETISNDIACSRTDYLFYPAASEPKDFVASELSPLLAASSGWVPLTDYCNAWTGQTTTCFTRNGELLGVVQNLPSSDADYRISIQSAMPKIDETGYDEFTKTVKAVPGVYVSYSSSYFDG